MKLLIAGGGTGGHVFTGIALAQELMSRGPGSTVLFVGTQKGLESRLVPQAGFALETVDVVGFKGLSLQKKIRCLALLPRSFLQAFSILWRYRPDAIVGVGGYASFPIVTLGSLMGFSTAIVEQNSVPGLANKVLGHFVKTVFLAFDGAKKYFQSERCLRTGNPVRQEVIHQAQNKMCPPPAVGTAERFNLLVFGGSQGAQTIDRAMIEASRLLSTEKTRIAVRHQTNGQLQKELEKAYADSGINAEVSRFFDDMGSAYAWADLIICRAGAISVSEVATLGKAAIFVPFPFATDNHQEANARTLTDHGGGILLHDRDLNGHSIARIVLELLSDRSKIANLESQALKFSSMRAAQVMLDQLSL